MRCSTRKVVDTTSLYSYRVSESLNISAYLADSLVFPKLIAEIAGNTNCDIQPCHSNEFPSPVKRPAYSVLDKAKIKNTFNILIPYWLLSLEECIKKLGG